MKSRHSDTYSWAEKSDCKNNLIRDIVQNPFSQKKKLFSLYQFTVVLDNPLYFCTISVKHVSFYYSLYIKPKQCNFASGHGSTFFTGALRDCSRIPSNLLGLSLHFGNTRFGSNLNIEMHKNGHFCRRDYLSSIRFIFG